MPEFQVGQSIFWIAWNVLFLYVGVTQLLALMEVAKEPDQKKRVKQLFRQGMISLACLVAFMSLALNQGGTATTQNTRLHAPSDPVPAFRDIADPLPPDHDELREKRERHEDLIQQGKSNSALGSDMSDFRQRVLNRDLPISNTQEVSP